MRVVLMHNPTAGREDHRVEDIEGAIERAGHKVVASVSRRRQLARALGGRCDLVAVAGGDGTVGKAAEVLVGKGVPFTILALGTANNMARTFKLDGPFLDRIEAWEGDVLRDLDAARATLDRKPAGFIEAVGFGAFPTMIRAFSKREESDDPGRQLARALASLRRHVERARPRPYAITADGLDASGRFLMVEVLNIPFIGPRVPLGRADPGDGRLDLVLVGEADRDELLRGLDRLREGEAAAVTVPSRAVRAVTIRSPGRYHHRDGELEEHGGRELRVRVKPGALTVLAPR